MSDIDQDGINAAGEGPLYRKAKEATQTVIQAVKDYGEGAKRGTIIAGQQLCCAGVMIGTGFSLASVALTAGLYNFTNGVTGGLVGKAGEGIAAVGRKIKRT